jgi:hypothetical protein
MRSDVIGRQQRQATMKSNHEQNDTALVRRGVRSRSEKQLGRRFTDALIESGIWSRGGTDGLPDDHEASATSDQAVFGAVAPD